MHRVDSRWPSMAVMKARSGLGFEVAELVPLHGGARPIGKDGIESVLLAEYTEHGGL